MASNSSAVDDYEIKETATVNWTINGFTNLNSEVYSELFSPPNSKNNFRIYLNSKTNLIFRESVFITIWYNDNENEVLMRFRVSIMNANGEKQYTQENYWKYSNTVNCRFKDRVFICFKNYNECLLYLNNDTLILSCEVDILNANKLASDKFVDADNCQTNLQNDYQALLETSKFSDAALLVKDKEFKVHKAILATRSKVFEAMFSAALEVKKQNRVEITDVEVDVFEHLLRYIYTGKIPEMDEYALELFVAADKYQLDHLKSICEQPLGSNLTTETVVNVLVIADMHNASELKSKCIEYITLNSDEVKGTDSWKEMKSRPALLMEIFDCMSDKMKSLSVKS